MSPVPVTLVTRTYFRNTSLVDVGPLTQPCGSGAAVMSCGE